MFVILIVGIDSWVYPYVKTDQTVHFKYALFRVLQSHLNKAEKKKKHLEKRSRQTGLGSSGMGKLREELGLQLHKLRK